LLQVIAAAWPSTCGRAAHGRGMKVERLDTSVYTIPTSKPEADGTISWDSTTVVIVEAVSSSG